MDNFFLCVQSVVVLLLQNSFIHDIMVGESYRMHVQCGDERDSRE